MHGRLVLGMLVLASVSGCAQPSAPPPQRETPPPDTRAADEATIHGLVKDWSAAAQAKDAEKFSAMYADDATVMFAGQPDVSGRTAIREALGGMMQDPNFALQFAARKIEVARSGDLAYDTGTYTLTMTDAKKQKSTEQGNYVVVWKKQDGGTWKVVIDAPISDPPPAAR